MPTSFWWVGLVSLGLWGLGAASLRWLAGQATSDRRLRRIVLGSFGLRTLLAVAFFVISDQRWPILRSLQSVPGFCSMTTSEPSGESHEVSRSRLATHSSFGI